MFVVEYILRMLGILFLLAIGAAPFVWFWIYDPEPYPDDMTKRKRALYSAVFIVNHTFPAIAVGSLIGGAYMLAAGAFESGDVSYAIGIGVLLGWAIFAWFLLLWRPFKKLASGVGMLAFARIKPLVAKKS